MKDLQALEEQYKKLGKEIEKLKTKPQKAFKLNVHYGLIVEESKVRHKVVKQYGIHDVGDEDTWFTDNTDNWIDLPICPKTGFYHKQLVWCWDNDSTHCRELRFYNATNNRTFTPNGYCEGMCFSNYAPFEGNWPDWALEAFKTLME